MKTYFVDAFTDQKFKRNPAAVCIMEGPLDEMVMQNIASEIGFSETAFISCISGNTYRIRYFTPKKEIALCGHATLGASKVIFESTIYNHISFLTIEGVELAVEKLGAKIKMQLPIYNIEKREVPRAVLEALGITQIVVAGFNPENRIVLLEIDSTQVLAKMQPAFVALVKSCTGINGVLVTAKSRDEIFDFHYRYFWPWAGTNEDAATGGVQTFLTKYWA